MPAFKNGHNVCSVSQHACLIHKPDFSYRAAGDQWKFKVDIVTICRSSHQLLCNHSFIWIFISRKPWGWPPLSNIIKNVWKHGPQGFTRIYLEPFRKLDPSLDFERVPHFISSQSPVNTRRSPTWQGLLLSQCWNKEIFFSLDVIVVSYNVHIRGHLL